MSFQKKYGLIQRIVPVFLFVLLISSYIKPSNNSSGIINWEQLDEGLFFAEITGPHISKFADSKISLLKISPVYFNFELVTSSESDSTLRTTRDWCELKKLAGGINAGMYSLKDHISGIGYMQNYTHINNPVIKENLNALLVFNPKNKSLAPVQIVDMKNQDWKSVLNNYNSCFQSIRMIDNNGEPVYWNKKPELKCSMSLLALDKSGNVLFIFTRSPYSANEMINFMKKPELHIQSAMYLEGGPEATLYVKTSNAEIIKFGSYVSYSKPDDTNAEERKMPNIIGFSKKLHD